MKESTLRIVSEYRVIEIDDYCLRYRPRVNTKLSVTFLPFFRDQARETLMADEEIPINAIRSFEVNHSMRIIGRPSIAISFQDPLSFTVPGRNKTQYLFFSEISQKAISYILQTDRKATPIRDSRCSTAQRLIKTELIN